MSPGAGASQRQPSSWGLVGTHKTMYYKRSAWKPGSNGYGWTTFTVRNECADAAEAALREIVNRIERADSYTVQVRNRACPKCNARPGFPCKTPSGKKREAHVARRKARR